MIDPSSAFAIVIWVLGMYFLVHYVKEFPGHLASLKKQKQEWLRLKGEGTEREENCRSIYKGGRNAMVFLAVVWVGVFWACVWPLLRVIAQGVRNFWDYLQTVWG